MAELQVTHPNGSSETVPLSRLRSDVCIPDAFASRLHAEVRQEGDSFWLSDLGSANGTRYNGTIISAALPIYSGGEIQIGETKIKFDDGGLLHKNISSTLIADTTSARWSRQCLTGVQVRVA